MDFAKAVAAELQLKCIIFFDEVDCLVRKRGSEPVERLDSALTSELLVLLNDLNGSQNKELVVIGATNNYDLIDPAALSRFQSKAFVPLPNAVQRADFFAGLQSTIANMRTSTQMFVRLSTV
jgi:SpoVK/Ycf46/Vps4 family AAA+-type ATPase